jgi:hypothetical protein
MSNKRISKESDPLIPLQIKIFQSQKEYLDDLKGSTSRTIRELIDFHRQRPIEKTQLVHDIEETKMKLKMQEAKLEQIQETERQEILLKTNFESTKANALKILVKEFRSYRGDFRKFSKPLQHWAGELKITPTELQTIVFNAAKSEVN